MVNLLLNPKGYLILFALLVFCFPEKAVAQDSQSEQARQSEQGSRETGSRKISQPTKNKASDESSVDQSAAEQSHTIVVTANRRNAELGKLLNNSEQLNRDELDFVDPVHINEALSRTSGVWISRGNGQEHLTAIRSPVFTGPGSCGEFLMLEDGVPLRANGFCNVNQLFDANTEQADAIEVVKGPNSALYGSNALHGLIHLISRSPDTNGKSVGLSAGPHQYLRLKSSFSRRETDIGWLINFNSTHDGGFKDDSGFEQQKFNLAYVKEYHDLSVTTRMSGSLLNQETAGFLQAGENAYRDKRFQKNNSFPEAFRDAWSVRLQTRVEKSSVSNDGLTQWHITPYLRTNKMKFLMHFLPGQPVEDNGHDSLGLQLGMVQVDERSEFSWGADIEITDAFLTQYQREATTTGSAFLNAVLPQGAHYNYRVNSISTGVFTQWQYQLSERWSTTVASRFDYLQYDYDNRLSDGNLRDDGTPCGFGGCRYTRPADSTDSFGDVSWSFASGYQWSEQQLSYLKIDRAFRAPQATELYRLQNAQLTTDFESTDAKSVEFGFRSFFDNGYFDITLFAMDKDNVIFQNSDREFVSGAKTSHRGVEVSGRYSLNKEWFVDYQGSYGKHTYENTVALNGLGNEDIKGNDIDTAPKIFSRFSLGWNYDDESKAEVETVFLDEYYTNPQNTRRYSGHTLVNFRVEHSLSRHWQSFVRVSNLTDRLYAERADFAFGNDRYFVGEPRSVFIGVRGKWF